MEKNLPTCNYILINLRNGELCFVIIKRQYSFYFAKQSFGNFCCRKQDINLISITEL